MKNKALKKVLIGVVAVLSAIILIALGYLSYVMIAYSRIEDNQALTPQGDGLRASVSTGVEYGIVTQNLGFGAYTKDFTFFMDGGKESWARSEESVIDCINKGADKAKSLNPDFVIFQEVDYDSTRSYHIDQRVLLDEKFADMSSAFAINYHSPFLCYPFNKPHGASYSGIYTFSNYKIQSSVRRSLPISTSFSKFLDLDRCYSVSRINVDNGKELIIYNVHLSAYGGSDQIRHDQMTMLFNDMLTEYQKGNYCVCGGDFNHDFTTTSTKDLNGGDDVDFGWAQPFPTDLLPTEITRCVNYTSNTVLPTCRNCDVPYEEGNFTIIVDGFLVTNNVNVTYLENVQAGFEYSDHNPVFMKFTLD